MALLSLHGRGARTLLQRCCCRDLERCLGKARGPLVPGRSVYTMFLDERGFVIDDAIVASQCADADYTVVVNASMGAAVAACAPGRAQPRTRASSTGPTGSARWICRGFESAAHPRPGAQGGGAGVLGTRVTFSFKGSFALEAAAGRDARAPH